MQKKREKLVSDHAPKCDFYEVAPFSEEIPGMAWRGSSRVLQLRKKLRNSFVLPFTVLEVKAFCSGCWCFLSVRWCVFPLQLSQLEFQRS